MRTSKKLRDMPPVNEEIDSMKVYIIYNPEAGSARRMNRLARLQQHLINLGNTVTTFSTTEVGEATHLARLAVQEGAEIVVSVGGDGTANEIIQGMAGSSVPLAIYPAGTTNVWCQQVNMPVNPRRAAEVISNGIRQQIDLGQAGDRYFLLMIGIGLDGEVVKAINLHLKKRLGKLAYLLAGLKKLNFKGTDINIVLDPGKPEERHLSLRSSLIIISNTERYATLKLVKEAQVNDGKLDLLVFQSSGLRGLIGQAYSVVRNRLTENKNISYFRVNSAQIQANPPVAAQVDGDFMGDVGPGLMDIKCYPRALQVIVPQKAPDYLFNEH